MTFAQIADLARHIRDTMRNGISRAAHYLRSLGVAMADAMAILFPAFV